MLRNLSLCLGVSRGLCHAGERHSFAMGSLQRRSMSINIHGGGLNRVPSHQYSTPQVGCVLQSSNYQGTHS